MRLPSSNPAPLVRILFIAASLSAVLASPKCVGGQPDATAKAAKDAKGGLAAGKADKDPFKIPDGGAKELQDYLHQLLQLDLQGATDEEKQAFLTKFMQTVLAASDRLIAAKPDDDQAMEAYHFKILALRKLAELGDQDAAKQVDKVIAEARSDPREGVSAQGWQAFIDDRVQNWESLDKAAKETFGAEVLNSISVKGKNLGAFDVMIVDVVSNSLEESDVEFVKRLLATAVPLLKKSTDKDVVKAVAEANFDGRLRRLNLPGNPLEISGALLNGNQLDWKAYRGKVVLVDFWATWCGYCRQEVPNILQMYAEYHDKGFDVVGVSLDDTKEAADKYVRETRIPWPSLLSKDENERGWNQPLARYYAVTGIPLAILVDKQGKVVDMNARGPRLREQLQKLFGDPPTAPATNRAQGQ